MVNPPAPLDGGRATPRRHRLRIGFLLGAAVLSLLLAAGSTTAVFAVYHYENSFDRGGIPVAPPGKTCASNCLALDQTCVRNICNFLVLGSDTRTGLTPKQQQQFGNPGNSPGERSDTIIVVQIDPVHDRTVVLSIPRDLRVPIPGHGVNKINTAFNYGPNSTIRTVENLTGLRINHYVEVNFLGFQGLVDALGGVPVCTNKPLIDKLAGLNLSKAGCYNLRGGQALAFVRARHIEGDVIPDFSRIARQQQFIRAIIQKALSLRSIFKFPKLIAAAQRYLVHDRGLDLYQLQDLTQKLTSLGQRGVEFRVLPARPVTIDGIDYVEGVQPQASMLLTRIRRGLPLGSIGLESPGTPISPANVTVQIWNAGNSTGAAQVQSFLQRAGFVVRGVQDVPAGFTFTRSEILWGHGSGAQSGALGSYLTLLPKVYDNAHTSGAVQIVMVGPDFKGVG